jgi:hypothetical protein
MLVFLLRPLSGNRGIKQKQQSCDMYTAVSTPKSYKRKDSGSALSLRNFSSQNSVRKIADSDTFLHERHISLYYP